MVLEVGGISPVPTTSCSSGGGGQEAPCRAVLGGTSSVRFGALWGLSLSAAGAMCRESFWGGFPSRTAGFGGTKRGDLPSHRD